MRRAIEILVLAVFLGIGVAAVTGNLPLPHLNIDSSSLGPIEATSEPASGCASCTADCPLAGGGSQDDTANADGDTPGTGEATGVGSVPVHAELSNSEELPEAIADATGLPLSGGVITETRRGVADGQSRIWVDIATSSPVEEATQWYRGNLSEAGWELLDDQPDVVPNGEFLSFERDGITLNVLFETTERHTRIFVDYPQQR